MAKIISLSAVILSCILVSRAEPTVNAGYTVGGEDNGFAYGSNIINNAYVPGAGKEGQRETGDFYNGGTGHSLTGVRSQGNLEESLRSSSYSGFSPSSHNAGYGGYSTVGRENLGTSPYFNAAQSGFDNYASSSSNVDSTLETYTQGSDHQPETDFNQFSVTKHKAPSYMRFSDSLPGTSTVGGYPELSMEGSALRGEYPTDGFRGHSSHSSHSSGFMDADQSFNRDAASLFHTATSDYSFGKHKEPAFAVTNKYAGEAYSPNPDSRYVRGGHGNVRDYASAMSFLANSGSTPPFRGTSGIYGAGKFGKYSKYASDYAPGLNYLSKEQDVDNYFFGKNTGTGKLTAIKDGRPGGYSSQSAYPGPGGSSYLGKLFGGYKSRPSYVSSYPGSSPVGYSSMASSLHGSLSGSSYGDNPLLRRYRSSSYGHPSMYPGYY